MKSQLLKTSFRRVVQPALIFSALLVGSAQAASFKLNFVNGLDATTNVACGSATTSCVYRNVVFDQGTNAALASTDPYQRDVIVSRVALVNAVLNDFDDDTNGTVGNNPQFFSPIVSRLNQNNGTQANGYAQFRFTFYAAGAAPPATVKALDGGVFVTALDTDGNIPGTSGLREFVTLFSPTNDAGGTDVESITPVIPVTGTKTYRNKSDSVGNGISLADNFKVSIFQNNPSTFDYVVGSTFLGNAPNQTCSSNTTTCNRLGALSFDRLDALPLVANVNAYKSAKLTTDADGNGVISPSDTVTYTVTYVNTGNVAVNNFQIVDALPTGLTATAGAQTVRLNGTVTATAKNALYTGAAGATANLLATGQTLAAGGTVSVDIPTTVGATVADNATLSNQTTATVGAGSVSSDNVDTTSTFPPSVSSATGFAAVPAGSIAQTQAATVDATTVTVRRPPQLTLTKTVAGRANVADQFTVQIKNGATPVATSPATTGTGTSTSTGVVNLVNNTAYTLTETVAGSANTLANYTTAIACTNTSTGTTLPSGAGQSFSITPKFGDVITCTLTNTPILADLSINKTGTASLAQTATATYTLKVWNQGPSSVTGAVIADTVPSNLTGVTWTCAASGSATCGTASGTGSAISFASGLLPVNTTSGAAGATNPAPTSGDYLTITVTGTATTQGSFTNTASITAPSSATDTFAANNSSSQSTTITPPVLGISGQVYEDYNYGGGAGRAYAAASGMSLRQSVRVELYSAAGGNVLATAFTDASGAYTFAGQLAGNYKVRVVNSFVTSSRTGACAFAVDVSTPPAACTQLPVQTYVNGTSQVGGATPAGADPALSTTTLPAGAESVASVTLGVVSLTGVDFGYNFSTVVNTNNTGQGSLRQFMTNADALANSGLTQSGNRKAKVTNANESLPAARDTSIFMVPSGALTGGVAAITVTSALPALSQNNISIDGTTETVNIGDSNTGTVGTGGTVGYLSTLTLDTVQKPEVQLRGASTVAVGLDLQANNAQVRGLSIYGFGNGVNSDNNANIRIGTDKTGAIIEANIVGAPATDLSCLSPSTTAAGTALSNADNLRSVGGDNGTVQNNLIVCAAGKGFGVEGTSTGWSVLNNQISGNAIGNTNLDGIDMENGGTKNITVRGNLFTLNAGVGVDGYQGGGSNTIEQNTIQSNGFGQGGAPGETAGVRLYFSNSTVKNNLISGNYGAGVMVTDTSTGNLISQNSIFDNGVGAATNGAAASAQLGIDLSATGDSVATGNSPYYTKNDDGDSDNGGNTLLNFPVFTSAQILSGNLILTGYARPGSVIELFIAAPDPSGSGEGKTYLSTLTEGAVADTDTGTGSYSDPARVGSDTTNKFKFTLALPSGVAVGTILTATATCSTSTCTGFPTANLSTSEFSYNITVANQQAPVISLLKLGRNVTQNTAFIAGTGSVGVLPKDVVEYCLVYENTGGAAPDFKITDNVPAGVDAQLGAYAAGRGIRWANGVTVAAGATTGTPAGVDLTSASADDQGTLTTTGGTFGQGLMTFNLGAAGLAAGGKGTVCFQTKVP